MIKRVLFSCILLISFAGVYASEQRPSVKAWIEPDSMAIGDRARLIIEVDQDMMQVVAFPDLNWDDMQSEQMPLEMAAPARYDTLSCEGRRLKLRGVYEFTTFEEGHYNLGRASVLYADKNVVDTLYSRDSLRLSVGTFLIDSTSHSIYDIKPLRDLPFKFAEISGYSMWSILGLLILIALIYATLKIMAHYGRDVLGLFKTPPPPPPHIAALNSLTQLRKEKLWQAGDYKSYYSRLTDILRLYITGRYGVAAVSMTTDEIISAARELELPSRCEMEMQALLRDADLVKFAKAQIEASQNESYFESVRNFVELTKPIEEIDEEQDEESNKEIEESKEKKSEEL